MKRLIQKLLCGLAAVLLVPGLAFGQEGTIQGTITDAETNDPLPGATVQLPDLGLGAATAPSGEYVIDDVPAGEHVVNISFVGYEPVERTVEVTAGETTTLSVALTADVAALDEVVVVGYGQRQRRDVTGSITSVQAEEIETRGIVSADQALQGQASGVQVVSTSGEPGGGFDVRVRGTGSITAGNQPLYVVDGVPINAEDDVGGQASTNPLSGIRAQDIASIEVLKDAAAASIYGAQAANGVVLITTKGGTTGPTRITASVGLGQVTETTRFNMLDTPEWFMLMTEAFLNASSELGIPRDPDLAETVAANNVLLPEQIETLNQQGREALPSYDWQDAAMQQGFLQEYSVSASGGTEDTRFRVSGAYDFREGQYIRSDFDRWALRASIDHDANERLSFETRVGVSSQEQQGSIRDGNFINGVLFGAPFVAPNIPIREDDGSFQEGLWPFGNPIQAVQLEDRFQKTRRILASASATYSLTQDLSLRLQGGVDYSMYRDRNYRPPVGYYEPDGGTGFEATREITNFNISPVLNYSSQFEDVHNVNATAGAEYRREFEDQHGVNAQGYPNPFFRRVNSAANITDGFGFSTEYRIAGTFGRVEYNYDQTYYASVSARYDGSSRFGADNRWGFFYSGSLGWDISQMDFMADVDWVNQLQPRISYGTTGNSQIGNFQSRGLYGVGRSYVGEPDLRPSQLANPLLTWEEKATLNLALDASILNGRVSGTIEAYRSTSSSLLLDAELPTDSGFDSITENVGRVRNEGLEFQVSTVNLDLQDFIWRSDFNIAFQRNEVLELAEPDQEQFGSGNGNGNNPGTIIKGEPIHVFYAPEFAGVNPADGRPMWYDADGNITYNPDAVADAKVLGSPYSDVIGGLTNTFSYAGLSLRVFFQFDLGAKAFKQQQSYFYETPQFLGNMTENMLERWQEPGDITPIPEMHIFGSEAGTAEERTASSRHVVDRSYVRLKSLRMAYQIPSSLTGMMGVGSFEVYAQAENLLTFTEYEGMDPEIRVSANGYYPAPKVLRAGINMSF